jgi:hypothetical protein
MLAELTPMIARRLVGQEIEYVFKMKYLSNTRRVRLTPKVCWDSGYKHLADLTPPKDRWIAEGEEAVSYPPIPDREAEEYGRTLFDRPSGMARAPNPKIP